MPGSEVDAGSDIWFGRYMYNGVISLLFPKTGADNDLWYVLWLALGPPSLTQRIVTVGFKYSSSRG